MARGVIVIESPPMGGPMQVKLKKTNPPSEEVFWATSNVTEAQAVHAACRRAYDAGLRDAYTQNG